ncbi:Chromo domain-containing protein 2 [Pseudocercospora fuligena]|uniref:Chromo domain-containing protein 2 n=1 Tax=Pseudocercospora fuligena TaxID=685502 RepID=A0A8H6RRE1_9PEZI|nr:Chromo domain-containing protein 2 [Pseudocercospora fuligena]
MPPAASESGSDDLDAIPAKPKAQKDVAMDDEEDEDDEDEYQVEKIEEHSFVKGKVIYKVKWLGYDEEDDKTWEPIENLVGAKEALGAYHRAIGGTPEPPMKGKKPTKASLGKRNSTQADLDSPAPSSNKKGRGRKSDANGTSAVDTLPVGSWEDHVSSVAAIVESEEVGLTKGKKDVKSLEGLLEWNDGRKTQHKMNVLRQKCPQRLLDYYESHLLKPKLEEAFVAEDYD